MKKVRSILVIGRRWFQRGPGNTYHTAQVVVNGKTVHKSTRQYGYGESYLQTAQSWLESNGHIMSECYANGNRATLWQTCERLGIAFEKVTIDVERQADL
jgi:hypothetical protein